VKLPSKILEDAVEKLSIFPGIGKRSALRMVIHLLQQPDENVFAIGNALNRLKEEITMCQRCYNIAESTHCEICQNPRREDSLLCVVENFTDILAIESTGQFKGLYHVLGGLISPMDGITADELNIDPLFDRVKNEPIKEIIFALSATMEGDTSAFYIRRKMAESEHIVFSQLSRGVSLGTELEYADEATLANSIINRTLFSQ